MNLVMKYEKSTKGTHRFKEIDGAGREVGLMEMKIGTLYIRKLAMPTPPAIIKVHIEEVKKA